VKKSKSLLETIKPGSRVTIRVPAGLNTDGSHDWQERTGSVVMRSSHGGWVLNMGGPHGTPGVADAENIVAVGGKRL
jgi:hypothetical protein